MMTPLWRIRSGTFAGWHTNDLIYNADGRHIGYLAGHVAYSLEGAVLGEIHQGQWIGMRQHDATPPGQQQAQREAVAHARLPDRTGLQLDNWQDPAI